MGRGVWDAVLVDALQAKNLESGEEYETEYTKLVLSTGASPVRPPLPGIDLPNIFTLRDVPDARVAPLGKGSHRRPGRKRCMWS